MLEYKVYPHIILRSCLVVSFENCLSDTVLGGTIRNRPEFVDCFFFFNPRNVAINSLDRAEILIDLFVTERHDFVKASQN